MQIMSDNILINKPEIEKNGETIVDLLYQPLRYRQQPYITGGYEVNQNESMRPDLIANKVYGNPNDFDVICKHNGISNPFSLDVEDFLIIPELNDFLENITDPNIIASDQDFRKRYLDESKRNEPDSVKLAYDVTSKEESEIVPSQELPPNFADVPNGGVQIQGGLITFGTNIGKDKDNCDQPISKSRLLSKLITNNIIKENDNISNGELN